MLCFDDGDNDKNAKEKKQQRERVTERRMLEDMKVVTAKEGEKRKMPGPAAVQKEWTILPS